MSLSLDDGLWMVLMKVQMVKAMKVEMLKRLMLMMMMVVVMVMMRDGRDRDFEHCHEAVGRHSVSTRSQ